MRAAGLVFQRVIAAHQAHFADMRAHVRAAEQLAGEDPDVMVRTWTTCRGRRRPRPVHWVTVTVTVILTAIAAPNWTFCDAILLTTGPRAIAPSRRSGTTPDSKSKSR